MNGTFPGLGDAAVHYVLDGGSRDVLDRLAVSGAGKRIEAQGASAHSQSVTLGRYFVLGMMLSPEPDLCARYTEVLNASLARGYVRPSALPGVPLPLQDYLNNLLYGIHHLTTTELLERFKSSFRADALLPFARQFGAKTADLLVALYNDPQTRYSSYSIAKVRERLDRKPLLLADPAALGIAAARLGEAGRISLVNDVVAYKLATEEPGLGLVMDLAGNNLKAVREATAKAVATIDPALREAEALKRLKAGDATMREAMAGLLLSLGTPTARAALEAHLPGERAAAVRAVIERLTKGEALRSGATDADDETGYVALGGVRVAVPPVRPLRSHDGTKLGADDTDALRAIFDGHLAQLQAEEATRLARYPNASPKTMPKPESVASLTAFLNGAWDDLGWRSDHIFRRFANEGGGKAWTERALERLSQEAGLRFALCVDNYLDTLLAGYRPNSVSAGVIADYAAAPEGDLRQVMRLIGEHRLTVRHGTSAEGSTAFLTGRIRQDRYDRNDWLRAFPAGFLWPWIAGHLAVLEDALRPAQLVGSTDLTKVIAVLRVLPATPERLVAPLLDHATSTSRDGRAEARTLLADLPKLDDHLADMLADKRQAVRAVVADWLADRRAKAVIPRLEKALAKETAAKPRAAMLGALRRLGGNLEPFVGETVLNRAAAEGIKKADFGLVAWMDFKAMPPLTWRSGAPVPRDTQMFWLYQALRLKAPRDAEMFAVYLDQCDPSQAQAFSDWAFNAWIDRAEFDAPLRVTWENKDPWQGMPKSIESKGILALGIAADGRHAARRVRAFLKKHGQQSQHCAALIELLAAKGDPASLQVVLAAATRIKQKSLQKLSGDLVAGIAEDRGWTPEELADRTVPDCGLDEDGGADLPLGRGRPDCRMVLNDALELVLLNGAGQPVKSFPAVDTPETTESKSLWAATKKELAATVEMQAGRLNDAMIAGRTWALTDWQRDTLGHPIMAALACQLVWQGLGEDDQPLATFRPLTGGGAMGPLGDRITLDGVLRVRLAHGALLTDADTSAWEAFVKPRRTKPPITQFGRPARRLHPDMATHTQIADREGWVTDTFTIRGIAKRLGYDRGEIVDSGGFSTYVRRFASAGYEAVLTFSGSGVPEENLPASPLHVSFRPIGGRGELPLGKVPPVLLSEGWNDYHDLAAKGRYDPNWLKLMPFM
ncbi:DUF4132 domain-containing protein [Tabrizicola sp.]|uniref:DUF4132 domain-containing protein n=1 Tax=Tabrizicola sp. TaxID=2005166 RepID=UPI003F2FFFE9